ncbi:MAG: insulinase family protein, partial [Desulforhopalus sp.]
MIRYDFIVKTLWFILGLVVAASVGLSGYAYAEVGPKGCFDTRWPSELSDLEHDRSLIRGVLDNGFRYVIKNNEEPENRVAVFLDVQAGSLQEREDQRGLAHFLEHLMFNGSANFPPGSLVDFFQSIGMSFG